MALKYKTSKIKSEIDALAALESKANRVPSPPSKYVNGKLTNVCPACAAPCSVFPWSCPACGWTAAAQPALCACRAINDVIEIEIDEWAYPTDSDLSESPLLSAADKAAWASAKATSKDAKDIKPKVKP